jgi:cold shock protein
MRPETKWTSRDNRSSLETITGPPNLRAALIEGPGTGVSGAPTPKPLPLGYGEPRLTIGPGRRRASFHQSRSFRIYNCKAALRPCGPPKRKGPEEMTTGRVKFFNGDKGYGFIEPDDGTKDVFVHITSISDASLYDFREDRRVSFDERISQRNAEAGSVRCGGAVALSGRHMRRRFPTRSHRALLPRPRSRVGARQWRCQDCGWRHAGSRRN